VYPPSTLKGEEDKAYKQIYFLKIIFSKYRGPMLGRELTNPNYNPTYDLAGWG